MKTIFSLILSLLITHGFSQNLLLNGGAELGDISSWFANSNAIGATTLEWQPDEIVNAQEGDYFFTFHNEPDDSAILSQQGNLDNPSGELSISGYFHGEYWPNIYLDYGEVILSLFDSDNILINSVSTGQLIPELPISWIEFSLNLPVDSNSYSWKVELKGDREAGNYINVYYDNILLIHTTTLSLNDIEIKDSPSLYPNPFSNVLFIKEELRDLKEIRIYSMNGIEIIAVLTINNNEIDLSNISSGQYLVAGYNNNKEIIFKEKIIKK